MQPIFKRICKFNTHFHLLSSLKTKNSSQNQSASRKLTFLNVLFWAEMQTGGDQ